MAATKPRVVFFLSDLEVGGLQRHALDLSMRLKARGFFSNIVVYRDNVSPQMLNWPDAGDWILLNETKRMLDPRGWPRAWRTISDLQPDVVIGVSPTPINVLAMGRAAGRINAKLACTYGSTLPRPWEWTRRPLFRWALRRTDALVYCSRNQAAYWGGRGLKSRRDIVIYNGTDTDRYAPASQDAKNQAKIGAGLSPDDFVVGLLGAFRWEKNQGQLVEAVHALRARGAPAKVLFVGDGPTRKSVEALTADLGMTEHVVFAGEHADVRPFIQAMDVGVLCSFTETFSLAALEILATGVPMVLSHVGGASEMVQDGVNGYLFPVGDTDKLAGALLKLADAQVRAGMSEQARKLVVQHFSVNEMVDSYDRLFLDLTQIPTEPAAGVTGEIAVNPQPFRN